MEEYYVTKNETSFYSDIYFAGFWKRTAAFILDIIILGVIEYFLGYLLFDILIQLGWITVLIGFFIQLLYFGILDSSIFKDQTIGKKIFKISVVSDNGKPISLWVSIASRP
ncbi:MAG TPA: RDD family protein [Desulfomonilia bacterium]